MVVAVRYKLLQTFMLEGFCMFSVSKLPTLATVLAVLLLIAGIVIIATAIDQDSANELRTNTETDHTFFVGFGCLIASFLIAPSRKHHHW